MSEPIACTLTADQFDDRAREIADLAHDSVLQRRPLPGGVRLTFQAGEDTARRLHDLVAAESQCCAFLEMDLRASETRLELDITGPEDARPIIDDLFA
jgi:hypothetical protein